MKPSARILTTAALVALCSCPSAQAAVSCSVSAPSPLDFGNYVVTAAISTSWVFTVSCSLLSGGTTTVSVVDSFSVGSGTYAARTMLQGGNTLTYNLYKDAALTQIRGDGTQGTVTGSGSFTLTKADPTQSSTGTIYGYLPANQDVPIGLYQSSPIVITITY